MMSAHTSQLVTRPAGTALQAALALHKAGRLEAAEAGYRALLARDPDDLDALHLLGKLLVQSGRSREAIEAVQRAVAQRSNAPALHNTLGLAYQAAENEAAAESAFRQALALRPGYAEAHVNLGNLLRCRGDKVGALEELRAAAKANYVEAAGHLAMLLAEMGRHEEAVESLELANQLRPGRVELLASLGAVLADLKRPEAEERLRQALAVQPDHAGALCRLGRLLIATFRPEEGFACLEKAVAAAPANATVRAGLAQALEKAGRVREAKAQFAVAVQANPRFVPGWLGLARCCVDLGCFEEASRHCLRAFEIDPENEDTLAAIAQSNAGDLKSADLDRLERASENPAASSDRRRSLHTALAEYYEMTKDYERAFLHISAFNRERFREMTAAGIAYDEEADKTAVDSNFLIFDRDFFRTVAGWGEISELPVFIMGMPRTGKTLCERILTGHSQVHGAGELNAVREIAVTLQRQLADEGLAVAGTFPECASGLTQELGRRLAARHLDMLRRLAPQAERIIDTTPGNYMLLGLIAVLFSHAKIIHCRRDPVDTCFACYAKNFTNPLPWASDLTTLGRHYRQYDRIMHHWRDVLPVPMLEVSYEELVDCPEKVARRIVDFCDLEWEDGCARLKDTEQAERTASRWQGRQPLNQASVGRWRHFERDLGPLVEALGDCRHSGKRIGDRRSTIG